MEILFHISTSLLILFWQKIFIFAECTDTLSDSNPYTTTIDTVDQGPKEIVLTSCIQLFQQYPVLCETTTIGGEGGMCCQTCGDTTCMDKVTEQYPLMGMYHFMLPPFLIKSCDALVSSYTSLCKEEGKDGGACCQKCKEVTSLDCINDFRVPSSVDVLHGEKFGNCGTYVRKDRCRCAKESVKQTCCKACQNIDTEALGCDCINIYNKRLRPQYTMWIDVFYFSNTTKAVLLNHHEVLRCKEFSKWYSYFCGASGLCCKSCKNVDNTCVDNLYWKTTVTSQSGECTNCGCHDIRKTSKQLMREACSQDVAGTNLPNMGTREACCHQCRRLGFGKPDGYKAPEELKYQIAAIAK